MKKISQYLSFRDIHNRLLRNIALNVELLYNEGVFDISEYDIQSFVASFLRNNLKNTDFRVDRENLGKFDCVITHIKGLKMSPPILFEIKSYVKIKTEEEYKIKPNPKTGKLSKHGKRFKKGAHEEFNDFKIDEIEMDFYKLKEEGLNEFSTPKKKARAFFILVCKKRDVESLRWVDIIDLHFRQLSVDQDSTNKLLDHHVENKKKTKSTNLTVIAKSKSETESICVLSWEIK
ncbi:MAG TPA: hypothetical protein DCF44_05580 [Chitinophagaceae bacterium]|nr:hypothetical protein [Chitinophagaceae bacterium]